MRTRGCLTANQPPQTPADPRSAPPQTRRHRRPDSSAQAADDLTGGTFVTGFATHELAELRGVLTPSLVIGLIQQLANCDALRRTQLGNEMSDLDDHRVHAEILAESDSDATFVSRAFNR